MHLLHKRTIFSFKPILHISIDIFYYLIPGLTTDFHVLYKVILKRRLLCIRYYSPICIAQLLNDLSVEALALAAFCLSPPASLSLHPSSVYNRLLIFEIVPRSFIGDSALRCLIP